AGRLILDTFLSPDPAAGLASLAAELRQRASARLVTDLSWTRLTRWRALLAQIFENEIYRRQIPHFSEINVCYECVAEGRVPPTALLLAGWLASTLGWRAAGEPALRFERPGGDARLLFRWQQAHWPMGRLASFELISREEPAARIAVARTGEACGEVSVEVAGLEPVMNRVSLARSNDVLLLGEELSIYRPDPVFEQSLGRALEIAQRLGSLQGEQR
ncbi:MAG TPA: OpcA/G6PD domain-containing protein, partial [Bryobacterales bacterium]|nr:OpcA/G6PD domain-containing protein [Bryobacterales bacterium]